MRDEQTPKDVCGEASFISYVTSFIYFATSFDVHYNIHTKIKMFYSKTKMFYILNVKFYVWLEHLCQLSRMIRESPGYGMNLPVSPVRVTNSPG